MNKEINPKNLKYKHIPEDFSHIADQKNSKDMKKLNKKLSELSESLNAIESELQTSRNTTSTLRKEKHEMQERLTHTKNSYQSLKKEYAKLTELNGKLESELKKSFKKLFDDTNFLNQISWRVGGLRNAISEETPLEFFNNHPFDKFNHCKDIDLDTLHHSIENLVHEFNKKYFNISNSSRIQFKNNNNNNNNNQSSKESIDLKNKLDKLNQLENVLSDNKSKFNSSNKKSIHDRQEQKDKIMSIPMKNQFKGTNSREKERDVIDEQDDVQIEYMTDGKDISPIINQPNDIVSNNIHNLNKNKTAILSKPNLQINPLEIDEEEEILNLENNPNFIDINQISILAKKVFYDLDNSKKSKNNSNFEHITNLSQTVKINNRNIKNLSKSPNNNAQIIKDFFKNQNIKDTQNNSKKETRFLMTEKIAQNKNKKFLFTMQPYLRYSDKNKSNSLNQTPNNNIISKKSMGEAQNKKKGKKRERKGSNQEFKDVSDDLRMKNLTTKHSDQIKGFEFD